MTENAELKEPPLLGENNYEVLSEILRYSDSQIDDLKTLKII
jgi:crotonobetainyl-CoA:carnitine CoA-transferase CaiB-like acyl-CoA transferase